MTLIRHTFDAGFLVPLQTLVQNATTMKYSAIFIDFDDTLIDTIQDTQNTVEAIYTDHHLDSFFDSFEDYYENYFRPNTIAIWHLYEQGLITRDELLGQRFRNTFKHLPDIEINCIEKVNNDYLHRIVKATTLLPEAKELLDYLKGKYPLYMVSNGFANMQYTKIETAGLEGYFDGVVLSDEVGISKPDRRIYEAALAMAGVSADKAIMIGDNYKTDITGAHNAGIDQIWFNPKRIKSPDFEPTYIVDSLAAIQHIL